MHIEIVQRLRPFSHLPGSYVVLPGTSWRLQVFPTILKIDEISGINPIFLSSLHFDVIGPLQNFTIIQDLERGVVEVWGKNEAGNLRYRVSALASGKGVVIDFDKVPGTEMQISSQGSWQLDAPEVIKDKTLCLYSSTQKENKDHACYQIPLIDRLSLGGHKAQNWELLYQRRDFKEIFPLWHRLGQLIPMQEKLIPQGTALLLHKCQTAIQAKAPENILKAFENLFLAGFDIGLSPRLEDKNFLGMHLAEVKPELHSSALQLLREGSQLIRSLFVQTGEGKLQLLPALPPEFHCGRLLNVACGQRGLLSLEWTKKLIRRVRYLALQKEQIILTCSKDERTCRLRLSERDRGTLYNIGEPLDLEAGQNYWFDNFEK